MSSRAQKRQRQKDQRRARIEAEIKAAAQRKRRRLGINLSVLAVVAAGIALLFFNTQAGEEPEDSLSCDRTAPSPVAKPSFGTPPEMQLDPAKTYTAVIETSCGTVEVSLAASTSPNTVNSFVFLARQGFYDGLKFHRVIPGFAIQGGDPQGTGAGGPGYSVQDQPPDGTRYARGSVAMAKGPTEPPGTAGSQFFIVPGDKAETLPAEYAVLGRITKGTDVVAFINRQPGVATEDDQGQPMTAELLVYIRKITIREGASEAQTPDGGATQTTTTPAG